MPFNRPVNQQDEYFTAPREIRGPDGNVYDSANGSAELVQDFKSLSNQVSFSGDLITLNCSAQLQQRKLYIGTIIDDWEEFSLVAHVDLLLNNSVQTTIPIQKSYPPPLQIAPFNAAAGITLPPNILNPGCQWDRIVSVNQFTDSQYEQEELIQNELRGNFQYDRAGESTGVVYIYWFRISPMHCNIMINALKLVIDRWVAVKSDTDNPGVAAFYLAAFSQRRGNS